MIYKVYFCFILVEKHTKGLEINKIISTFARKIAKNEEMKNQLKLLSPALVVASLAAIASCLLIYEQETLWKAQEMNLFLDTPLFLRQQMVSSGWLLTWLGCWFTEFFYVPWLGVTLLTLWWAVLLLVIWRTFRIPVKWMAVLLIPLAAVVIMNVDMGYWIYYLKLRGHFFVAAIGTTLAVSAVWLYRANHFKGYENRKDAGAFHFVG